MSDLHRSHNWVGGAEGWTWPGSLQGAASRCYGNNGPHHAAVSPNSTPASTLVTGCVSAKVNRTERNERGRCPEASATETLEGTGSPSQGRTGDVQAQGVNGNHNRISRTTPY